MNVWSGCFVHFSGLCYRFLSQRFWDADSLFFSKTFWNLRNQISLARHELNWSLIFSRRFVLGHYFSVYFVTIQSLFPFGLFLLHIFLNTSLTRTSTTVFWFSVVVYSFATFRYLLSSRFVSSVRKRMRTTNHNTCLHMFENFGNLKCLIYSFIYWGLICFILETTIPFFMKTMNVNIHLIHDFDLADTVQRQSVWRRYIKRYQYGYISGFF